MNLILRKLLKNPNLRNIVPPIIRAQIKELFNLSEYNQFIFDSLNPYVGTKYEWKYESGSGVKIGILYDVAQYHRYYQSACIDLGVSYEVIDIRSENWLYNINHSNCNAFVCWPSLTTSVLKEMFDERTKIIEDLGFPMMPDARAIYLLDNKRRVHDWLVANDYEVPKTYMFYSKSNALNFIRETSLPIVFKSTKEGVSRGVVICRTRKQADKLVDLSFGKGFVPKRTDRRNRQWDFCMFQEYYEDVHERRMIRIGESYLAIDKVIKGDFHSGSGTMHWAQPTLKMLNLTKDITIKGNYKSMNVDYFLPEISKDEFYINELHAMFHGPEIEKSELQGRYIFNEETGWEFQQGNYYRNYCCNLRIMTVLDEIGFNNYDAQSWLNQPVFSLAKVPE